MQSFSIMMLNEGLQKGKPFCYHFATHCLIHILPMNEMRRNKSSTGVTTAGNHNNLNSLQICIYPESALLFIR
jgi:hypothetical protein